MGDHNPLINTFHFRNAPPKKTKQILSSFFSILALGTVFSAGFLAHDFVSPSRSEAFTMPTAQSAYGTGGNEYGQIGNCNNTNQSSIVSVNGSYTFSKVVSGDGDTLGLTSDGHVYAWGSNYTGVIGNSNTGSGTYYDCPQQVSSLSNITDVALGGKYSYEFALALKSDGTVWSWGYGDALGNGTYTSTYTPSEVVAPSGSSGYLTNIIAIAASGNCKCNTHDTAAAVRSDGTVWMWGINNSYQFGNGTNVYPNYESDYPVENTTLTNVKEVALGFENSFALESDGSVWSWGQNYYGDTGNTSTSGSSCYSLGANGTGAYCVTTPHQISGLSNITDISANTDYDSSSNNPATQALFVQSGGSLYTIGHHENSATQVSGVSGIIKAQVGYASSSDYEDPYIVALKSDGTVYKAQLTTSIGTASQISGISKVTDIAAGEDNIMMLSAE